MSREGSTDSVLYVAGVKLIIAAFTRLGNCDRCGHSLAEHLIGPDEVGQPRTWCLRDITGALTQAGRVHASLPQERP